MDNSVYTKLKILLDYDYYFFIIIINLQVCGIDGLSSTHYTPKES